MPKNPTPLVPGVDPTTGKKHVWPYAGVTTMTADAARNQWVKRIRGRLHSFGVLGDPVAALKRYQQVGPSLHAGLEPATPRLDGITLGEVCGLYLKTKLAMVETGDLERKTYSDYADAAARLMEVLGAKRVISSLKPADFEKVLRMQALGPTRRSNFVVWAKQIFRWAGDSEVIEALPRFGKNFKGGSAKQRRQLRNRVGKNLYDRQQILRMIDAASPQLRAMILLGINAGFGNTDCAKLTRSCLDLDGGMIDFPRPKTAVARRVPLWPETVAALKAVLADGREAKDRKHAALVFVTTFGNPWVQYHVDSISFEFRKLGQELGIIARPKKKARGKAKAEEPAEDKPTLGFYTLRRTFRTIADATRDQHAVHLIMGHTIPGMAGVYVQEIDTARLKFVTDCVHDWLYKGADVTKIVSRKQRGRRPAATAAGSEAAAKNP